MVPKKYHIENVQSRFINQSKWINSQIVVHSMYITLGLIWVGVNIFWLNNISNPRNHKWAKEKFSALEIKNVKIKFNEKITKRNVKITGF